MRSNALYLLFITHCEVSRDWIRQQERMQLGEANRATRSTNEVLYPVKRINATFSKNFCTPDDLGPRHLAQICAPHPVLRDRV